ncbi:hypothetical protein ABT063_36545 [Streptomyces sp. NPDC002838]|uniref:hypothetical protein n=1 Tax=Streptomyces sp. NPDC002838 TaxID=3154436 RepID=UPI003330EB71
MSARVEFDSLAEVEALLRAGIELKFELADDSALLNGSPVYATALHHLRDGLISGLRASSTPGKANAQADWYRLAEHPHRWPLVARRAALHPQWRDLSEAELRQWVETLAAPLVVDDETLAAVKAAGDEILDRG